MARGGIRFYAERDAVSEGQMTEYKYITTRREGRYKFHFLDTTPLEHAVVKRWLKPERKAGNP